MRDLRRQMMVVAAATSVLAATACTSSEGTAPSPGPRTPLSIPQTFNGDGLWETTAAGAEPPVVTAGGNVVFLVEKDSLYALRGVNPLSGETLWESTALNVSFDATGKPQLDIESVTAGGRSWLVAVMPSTLNDLTRIEIFDPLSRSTTTGPAHSIELAGHGGSPRVKLSSMGILANDVAGPNGAEQVVISPDTGARQTFAATLSRSRRIDAIVDTPVAGAEPGATTAPTLTTTYEPIMERAWSAYGGGVITSFDGGGFTYRGQDGGWSSENTTPDKALPGTGVLLGADRGVTLSSWRTDTPSEEMLVLSDLMTGRTLATHTQTVEAGTGAEQRGGSLIVSTDGQWAGYAQWAFAIRAGTVTDLGDGVVLTAIAQGVGYGTRKGEQIALDTTTGDPVGETGFETIPVAFDDSGHGLFLTSQADDAVLFSVGLKNRG